MTFVSFKKLTAWTVLLSQLVTPALVSAEPFFKVYIPGLKVTSGKPLPETNLDLNNPSVEESTAGSAILRVAPSTIGMGDVRITQESRWHTTRLTNLGSVPLKVGTTASESHEFIHTGHCDGVSLKPLESCDFNVKFKPTQLAPELTQSRIVVPFEGDKAAANAYLRVNASALPAQDPVENTLYSVEGSAPLTIVTAHPPTWALKFPLTLVSDPPVVNKFMVKNTGKVLSEFKGLTVQQNEENYRATSDCGLVIRPGEFCTVTVEFEPLTEGVKGATVVVHTNSHNGNKMLVQLEGEGLDLYPTIDTAKSTLKVDFGEKPVSTGPHTFVATLQNAGRLAMNVDNVTLGGAVTTGLSISNDTCKGKELAALGGKCTMTVNWTGSALSELDAYIRVVHNGRLAPLSPTDIPITGKAVPQTRLLEASPSSVDFGTMDVGVATTEKVKVTNKGNMPVTSVTLNNVSGGFSLGTTRCVSPLPVGASCDIDVNLNPTAAGPVSRAIAASGSSLTTASNSVTLSANAILRRISATPMTTLSLGMRTTNFWTEARTYEVTNIGSVRVTPTLEPQATLKQENNTCAQGIEPGEKCSFDLWVKPTTSSTVTVPVRIRADADLATVGVLAHNLTMQGTPQSYAISPASLDFGEIPSLTPVSRTLTVTNTGPDTALTGISLVAPVWAQPAGWGAASVSHNCPAALPPGQTCSVTVTATPKSYVGPAVPLSSQTQPLYIRFTGAESTPRTVPVEGSMKPSTVALSEAELDFGTPPVGVSTSTSPTTTLVVRNTGEHPVKYSGFVRSKGVVTLAIVPGSSTCVSQPIIDAGKSCTLTLVLSELTPSSVDERTATYSVQIESAGGVEAYATPTVKVKYIPGAIEPSTELLDFGTVGEQQSVVKSFTFKPSHGEAGSVVFNRVYTDNTRFSISGIVCTDITSSIITGRVIPATSTCTVNVQHVAGVSSSAVNTANVFLEFSEGSSSRIMGSVAVKATHEPVSYEILYNDLDFGDVPSLGSAAHRFAVIKNTSAVAPIVLDGKNGFGVAAQGPFIINSSNKVEQIEEVSYPNCYTTSTLNPGASCYVSTRVGGGVGNALAVGEQKPTAFVSTAHQAPVTVPMRVNLLPAKITFDQTALDYGFINSGQEAIIKPIVIANEGQGYARFEGAAATAKTGATLMLITGSGTPNLRFTSASAATNPAYPDNCSAKYGSLIGPGESCVLYVQLYSALATNNYSSSVELSLASPTTQNTSIPVKASVIAGSLVIEEASGLVFGKILTASTHTRTAHLRNEGSGAVRVYDVGISSAVRYPNSIVIDNKCPEWLGAGATCEIDVTLTPAVNEVFDTSFVEGLQFRHNSGGGTAKTELIKMRGESYGALLTPSKDTFALGNVDQADGLPRSFNDSVTYTASGEAPVYIATAPGGLFGSSTGILERVGGTCAAGTWLQVGESCTVELANRLATNEYRYGYFFNIGAMSRSHSILGIYGHTTEPNSSVPKTANSAILWTTATITSSIIAREVWPRVVFKDQDIEGLLVAAGVRENPSIRFGEEEIAGASRSTDPNAAGAIFSAKALASVVPAGTHPITIRNSDGVSKPQAITIGVSSEPYFSGDSAPVATQLADAPYMVNVTSRMEGAAVLGPNQVVVGAGNNLHLVVNQKIVNTLTLPAYANQMTEVGYSFSFNGNDELVVYQSIRENSWVSRRYRGGHTTRVFIVGVAGGKLSLQSASAPNSEYLYQLVTGDSLYGYNRRIATVLGFGAASSPDYVVSAVRFLIKDGGGSVAANRFVATVFSRNGATLTKLNSYELPIENTGSSEGGGVVYLNGKFYIRNGFSVTSYVVDGGVLVEDTRYEYPASMSNTTADGMAVSEANRELYVPCYANTVVCRISVNQGALGTSIPMAGTSGTIGYADGSYSSAKLSLQSVVPHYQGAGLIQAGIPQAVRGIIR